MTPGMPCELVTWTAVQRLAGSLAERIRTTGFRPAQMVAIARGGFVPARLLCDYLDITELTAIRIVHYHAGAERQRQARLVEGLGHALEGCNVLLVDDISDSGDTLALAREHLMCQGAGAVRIAVLHHKQSSQVVPDFHAQRITRWRWVIYPWAVHEDIGGFLRRLPQPPADVDDAMALLWQQHRIRVPRRLLSEVLANMHS